MSAVGWRCLAIGQVKGGLACSETVRVLFWMDHLVLGASPYAAAKLPLLWVRLRLSPNIDQVAPLPRPYRLNAERASLCTSHSCASATYRRPKHYLPSHLVMNAGMASQRAPGYCFKGQRCFRENLGLDQLNAFAKGSAIIGQLKVRSPLPDPARRRLEHCYAVLPQT